jgi:dihydrofolate synthase/folylpolyglutamate synthase
MNRRSLSEWLRWQESLHPRAIELGLDRVRSVAARLALARCPGPVFTVAGTNGKGSTVALLEQFMIRAGKRTGAYTSPHLVAYNERIRVDGGAASDDELITAFERVDAARGKTPLTFFEFGTLAAFCVFQACECDAWILEVGMGGRLDAVNVMDPDYAIITTVSLDHQEFLGSTVEEIAGEKAGILRPRRPGFYGDWPVPAAVRQVAAGLRSELHCLGEQFDFTPSQPLWSWRGERRVIEGLHYPPAATSAQLRNVSIVLAVLERHDPSLLKDAPTVDAAIGAAALPGRFQVVRREQEWVLDVAHNAQAAETLSAQLQTLPVPAETTIVVGMLGDKNLDTFVGTLAPLAQRWITCTVDDPRARSAASIAAHLQKSGAQNILESDSPQHAFALARERTSRSGRIVVCGSFRVVGPALRWLGIY